MNYLLITMISSGVILLGLLINMIFEGDKFKSFVGYILATVGIMLFYWYGLMTVLDYKDQYKEELELVQQEQIEKTFKEDKELQEQVLKGVKERIGVFGKGVVRELGEGYFTVIVGEVKYDVWVEEKDIVAITEGSKVVYYGGKIVDEVSLGG